MIRSTVNATSKEMTRTMLSETLEHVEAGLTFAARVGTELRESDGPFANYVSTIPSNDHNA